MAPLWGALLDRANGALAQLSLRGAQRRGNLILAFSTKHNNRDLNPVFLFLLNFCRYYHDNNSV
jgi:hypothetical protein